MDRNRPACLWERLNGHPSWQKTSWRGTTALTAYFNVCLIKSIRQRCPFARLLSERVRLTGDLPLPRLGAEPGKADTSKTGENNVTSARWLQHTSTHCRPEGRFSIECIIAVHRGAWNRSAWIKWSRNCIHRNPFYIHYETYLWAK